MIVHNLSKGPRRYRNLSKGLDVVIQAGICKISDADYADPLIKAKIDHDPMIVIVKDKVKKEPVLALPEPEPEVEEEQPEPEVEPDLTYEFPGQEEVSEVIEEVKDEQEKPKKGRRKKAEVQ